MEKLLWVLALTQVAFGNPPVPILEIKWFSPEPYGTTLRTRNLDGACLGGDAALLSTGIWLSYHIQSTINGSEHNSTSGRVWVEYNATTPMLPYQNISNNEVLKRVNFSIYQPEHGGGKCHCLTVNFIVGGSYYDHRE